MSGKEVIGKRFEKIIIRLNDKTIKPDKTISVYDDWAEKYEEDEQVLGYCMHILFVEYLEEIIKSESSFTKSSSILDMAAGTGLVGQQLRKRGFGGQIDAHDGSAKMLEMAKQKHVYQNFICHLIEPQTSMPKELSTGFYDILLVCGAIINTGHIPYNSLKQMLNCVRVGGLILYTIRVPRKQLDFEFRMNVEREAFILSDQEYWQLIDMRLSKRYRSMQDSDDENVHIPRSIMFCYKKLKDFDT